jgi:hypothetical protein
MIEHILKKELLYAMLATLLVFSIFKRFNFLIITPSSEEMTNVSYHYDKDFNTN